MGQVQDLVIETLDGIQRQVYGLRSFSTDIAEGFPNLTFFHVIVKG